MREAVLEPVRDLTPNLRGRRFSMPSITYKEEAIFLAMPPGPPTSREGFAIPKKGSETPDIGWFPWALYPEEVSGEEFSCDVVVASMDGWHELPLTQVNLWSPKLQCLSDGELLVVDERGWPREAKNACVYGMDGHLERSFRIGGDEDTFADESGRIWATYGDELTNTKEGGSALVRLDDHGRKQWGFNENRGDAESVWMFYALNVGPGVVWGCGYTEWEIVRIKDDHVTHWKQGLGGVDEIAVNEPHVLMVGAYHKGDPKFWLGRLGQAELEDVEEVRVTLPDGRSLRDLEHPLSKLGIPLAQRRTSYPFRIIGRNNALHVFLEDHWYRLRVEDVAE